MAIPDYQTIMLPLLRFSGDGKEHSTRESIEYLANQFKLTDDERKELLPSGTARLFDNRIGWASTYIRKAGLIESKRRGYFNITERGRQVLSQNLPKIDVKFLEQFSEFVEFKQIKKDKGKQIEKIARISPETNPEEALETAYQELQQGLAADLIQNINSVRLIFLSGW
jgi:restriction system protein